MRGMSKTLIALDARLVAASHARMSALQARGLPLPALLLGAMLAEVAALGALTLCVLLMQSLVLGLFAGLIFVSRGPELHERVRLYWSDAKAGPGPALADRYEALALLRLHRERHLRLGAVILCSLVVGLFAAAAAAGLALQASGVEMSTPAWLGLDGHEPSWTEALLVPAMTAVEIARRYAECARPALPAAMPEAGLVSGA